MKPEDIRELTDEEIQDRIRELAEERFRLRFRSATMELENPKLLTELRRDIARMKTVLRERELAQQS
jgi:large subunit ribosomal protein L29